jgi:hypothetical protein
MTKTLFWLPSVAFYVVPSVVVLIWAARAPRQRSIDAWAGAHGLDLDPAERRLVTGWLRRSLRLRTVGFLLPFLAVGLAGTFWEVVNPETPRPLVLRLGWWLAPVGYLVGVIVAEVSRRRSPPAALPDQAPAPTGAPPGAGPGMRAAALVPRRLGDYLPAWLPHTTRLLALAAVAAGVALVPLPVRTGQGWTDDPALALGTGLAALLVAGATELLARWLVGRSQPLTKGYRLALDDALRSTSVHATAAAGLALVLLLLARQLNQLAGVDAPGIGWVAVFAGAACLGAAFGCLVDLAQRHRWTVKRSLRPAGES